ncbi:MAG: 3-isopropylmalate dehydratase small subunit [Candidatus Micrarchaeota archaeon]
MNNKKRIKKMTGIKKIIGRAIPLPGNNIDTDRIMPARYLKEITFNDMGKYVFFDERFDKRFDKNGKDKNEKRTKRKKKTHPFNDKKFRYANILLVNKNFGCGSSREHAAQGIKRFGIHAIIGESFSHIFAENCAKLGILCVTVSARTVQELMQFARHNPQVKINISLETKKIDFGNRSTNFGIEETKRISFIDGTWDITELMRANMDKIKEKVKTIPYLIGF